MRDSGVQILGIQEHRVVHSAEIEYQDLGSSHLITTSAWRTSNGAAAGGVGIVLDKKTVFNSLISVYSHDRRTMVANFAGNPVTTVIVTYSPTEGATVEEAENYYDNLGGAIDQIPAHNLLFVVGDLNAHVSPSGTGPFTLDEYRKAKSSIKEGKAWGDDNIAPEVLKQCDLDQIVLDFCNNALLKGKKPDQWSTANIIPIPKKGDLSEPMNYRGISLSSLVAKALNRMILNRLKPEIETILRRNQNGFRPGRSTAQQILVLRRLIEGVKSRKLPAVLTFIDFKKAFDSVHRGKMFKILEAYGIPVKLVELIRLMYEKTMAKVLSPDGETELFEILAGVLQGDTLAPYLFAIVIDYCMRQAIGDDAERLGLTLERRKSRRVGPKIITDVDFADDIALISEDMDKANEFLLRVESAAASVGLHINEGKTKVMTLNMEDRSSDLQSRSGEAIEKVDDFIYLGSWIESTEREIRVRKGKAWGALHRLKDIWKSKLSKSLKIRLFIAACESVLLYGSETWTLTKAQEKNLDGTYTKMLRMVLGISWKDKVSNITLYGCLPRLSNKLRSRRLKMAGHCIRHPELLASDLVLWEPMHGRAQQGRPRQSYLSMLLKEVGTNSKEELRTLMRDRDIWRGLSGVDRT